MTAYVTHRMDWESGMPIFVEPDGGIYMAQVATGNDDLMVAHSLADIMGHDWDGTEPADGQEMEQAELLVVAAADAVISEA